jgi:hypothetical protein
MHDSIKFAVQILLTLALGVVVAAVVTYGAALIAIGFGSFDHNEWPATGNLISGTAFGLVVGYRFSTLNARSRKQKK